MVQPIDQETFVHDLSLGRRDGTMLLLAERLDGYLRLLYLLRTGHGDSSILHPRSLCHKLHGLQEESYGCSGRHSAETKVLYNGRGSYLESRLGPGDMNIPTTPK